MKFLIKMILIVFVSNAVWGQLVSNPQLQIGECGTELTQGQIDYMNQTREERIQTDLSVLKNSTTYLEVAIHVFIDIEGDLDDHRDFTTEEVDDAIQQLNTVFDQEDVGIQFVRCLDVNYISEKMDYPNLNTDFIHPGDGDSGI